MYPPLSNAAEWAVLVDERVAIMVVDGGMAEEDARREARAELAAVYRQLRLEHRRAMREHAEACVQRSNAARDHAGILAQLDATARPAHGFVYREGQLIPAELDGQAVPTVDEGPRERKGPPSLEECRGALDEWRDIVAAHADDDPDTDWDGGNDGADTDTETDTDDNAGMELGALQNRTHCGPGPGPEHPDKDTPVQWETAPLPSPSLTVDDGEEETDHEVASDAARIGQGADHEPSIDEQPSTAPQVSTSSLVGAVEGEPPAFQTLYADPPWLERGGGKSKRGADRHYDLLPWWDIVRVIYQSGAWNPADDAHLWMWVTANHREDGHRVAEALGFRPLTEVAWVKRRPASAEDLERVLQLALEDGQRDRALAELRALQDRRQVGLGQYLRGAHEVCMLCVRGRGAQVRTEARDIPSVLFAPRTRHSEKPAEMRELIERRSNGPRLELFARHTVPGWHAWGNQVGLLGGA